MGKEKKITEGAKYLEFLEREVLRLRTELKESNDAQAVIIAGYQGRHKRLFDKLKEFEKVKVMSDDVIVVGNSVMVRNLKG